MKNQIINELKTAQYNLSQARKRNSKLLKDFQELKKLIQSEIIKCHISIVNCSLFCEHINNNLDNIILILKNGKETMTINYQIPSYVIKLDKSIITIDDVLMSKYQSIYLAIIDILDKHSMLDNDKLVIYEQMNLNH